MVHLKYYAKENEEFSGYRGIYIDKIKVRELCNETCKHFNVNNLYIQYSSRMRNDGIYYESNGFVKFRLWNDRVNLLAVFHELAHHIDSNVNGKFNSKYIDKYGVTRWLRLRKSHTKLHRQCVIDIINYYEYMIKRNMYDNAPIIDIKGVIQ